MKYYKHKMTGEVFAFAADGSDDECIAEELVLMSEAQVFDHLNPALPPPSRQQIEAARLRAYAEPLTGSDRYFAEAQRMQVMNEPGWESVRAAGVARFEEIQVQFPWPPVDEAL